MGVRAPQCRTATLDRVATGHRLVISNLHLPGPEVSLPGLELRAWGAGDIPDLVSAWEDSEMHRWMPEEADPFGIEQAAAFVEMAGRGLAEGTTLAVAIADPRTD